MELIRLHIDDQYRFILEVSIWIVLLVLVPVAWLIFRAFRSRLRQRFDLVNLNIELGGIGKVELRPNVEDIQIAHRIWAELVTRKAALPIDPENDLLTEIYDSWYALFGRVRQLIGDIPGHLISKEESTQQLVRIATDTLNLGLRPHLTRWQARFRNWFAQRADQLKERTPHELQRGFPEYAQLIEDMKQVNRQLIQYAGELQKIVRGR